MEPLLPCHAAAALLSISPSTLRRLARQGHIAFVRVSPGRVAFERAELERYIARRRQGGGMVLESAGFEVIDGGWLP
jgi:excisionase family DNA binding protein